MTATPTYAMALWRAWRVNIWPWRHLPAHVLRRMGAA